MPYGNVIQSNEAFAHSPHSKMKIKCQTQPAPFSLCMYWMELRTICENKQNVWTMKFNLLMQYVWIAHCLAGYNGKNRMWIYVSMHNQIENCLIKTVEFCKSYTFRCEKCHNQQICIQTIWLVMIFCFQTTTAITKCYEAKWLLSRICVFFPLRFLRMH